MEKDFIIEEDKAWKASTEASLYSIFRSANECAINQCEHALLRCLVQIGIKELAPIKFIEFRFAPVANYYVGYNGSGREVYDGLTRQF